MAERPFSVLFPCTGNSARSIMAECALSRWGRGRFHAYCRGSHPTGQVHPMTLRVLQDLHSRTERPRSRSWKEFTSPRAPALDVVFTGDTLFQGGPGATGRSYSDEDTLLASIRASLFTLPGHTTVLTGHGDATSIAAESAALGAPSAE